MKRLVLFLPLAFFFTSCAQLFDSNLYKGIDTPPGLSAGSLSGKSIADIQAMAADDAFYEQLKSNPSALDAAQAVLAAGFTSVTTSSTTAEKAEAISAAQTYIEVTAGGSDVSDVVNDAILQAAKLKNGSDSDVTAAVSALITGKSEAEITALLTNLTEIGGALSAMQTAATVGTSVDATAFLGSTTNAGDLAQTSLVAAAVTALVSDAAGATTADKIAALSAQLAAGTTPTTGSAVTALGDALEGTVTTSNQFAYLNAIKTILPL